MKKIIWSLGIATIFVVFFGYISHSLETYSKPVNIKNFLDEIGRKMNYLTPRVKVSF